MGAPYFHVDKDNGRFHPCLLVSDSIVLDVAFTYCGGVVGPLAPSVVVVVLVVVDVELLGLVLSLA